MTTCAVSARPVAAQWHSSHRRPSHAAISGDAPHDNLIDLDRIRGQTEVQEFIIILIADLADRLLKVNERHGQRLRRSYYAWLASLLVAAFVLLWEHI